MRLKRLKKRYLKECGKDHVFKTFHNLGWSDSLNVKLTGWWAESTAPMGRLNSLSKTDKLLLTIRRIDNEDHIDRPNHTTKTFAHALRPWGKLCQFFFGYGFLHKWGNGAYQCPTLKWQLHDNYSMWNMGKRGFESLDMGIPCFWHGQIHTLSRLEYATFEFPPFWGSPWVNWHSQGDGRSVLLGWNSSLGLEPLGAPHATHAASGWGAASGWWQRPEERLLLNPPGNGWDDWVPVNQMHRVATPSLIPQSRDHWFGRQPLAQVLSLRENLEIISIDWLLTKNVTAVCTNPSRNLQFFFMCFYLLDPLSGWTFHSWWNLLPLAPISVSGFLPTPSLVPRRFHQDLPGLQGNQLRDLRWFLRRYLREYVLSICIFKD